MVSKYSKQNNSKWLPKVQNGYKRVWNWEKNTNKQPDTQNWVSSFQELHKFAVFSQEVLEFDTITSIKPEETSKKAAKTYKNRYITGFYFNY